MTMDAIYKERGSHWSHQVSAVATTRWLQRDQTLPLSAKGVACKTTFTSGSLVPERDIEVVHAERAWYLFSRENPQR